MQLESSSLRWRLGIVAAVAMTLLALYPQATVWRGGTHQWSGNYFSCHADESSYEAYIRALIDGRPRRNDPYSGRDDVANAPLPESLFSIQFVPAYALALPARVFNLQVDTAFTLLTALVAFASTLALFRLIAMVTNDERVAAAGALIVLCCGALARTSISTRLTNSWSIAPAYFPFLRSYLPAAPFPLFFILCTLMWLMLASEDKRARLIAALVAGAIFALLIFSYFYLWTAAAAWLCGLALLWLIVRPENFWRDFKYIALVNFIALLAFVPYWILLSRRATTTDVVQALARSHRPDIFRAPELIAALVLLLLAVGVWREVFQLQDRRVLFTASLALMPLAVFNQQVLTGHSLQPVHYELFIANYSALTALILTSALIFKRQLTASSGKSNLALACLALLALSCGMIESRYAIKNHFEVNRIRDEIKPVGLRLAQLKDEAKQQHVFPIVLTTNIIQADELPVYTFDAVLWSPHMRAFAGVSLPEDKERYYKLLYYTGTDEAQFADLLKNTRIAPSTIFGWERINSRLGADPKPVTPDEIREEVRRYSDFKASFQREQAAQPKLSYVVTPALKPADLSNLDRWYTRDAGERVGNSILYRVALR